MGSEVIIAFSDCVGNYPVLQLAVSAGEYAHRGA